MPATMDSRMVCADSGLPPAEHCQHVTTDFFLPLISPAAVCNAEKEVMISADERISYCVNCVPANGFKRKWYKEAAPELQAYFDQRQIAYERIPPHNPQCQRVFSGNGPAIVSPDNRAEYFIEKSQPEPIMLRCQAEADVARVYWYINNRFYKAALPGEAVFFAPEAGQVKISCTDDKGRNRDISILVTVVD